MVTSRRRASVSTSWRRWAVDNLLRGVGGSELVARLTEAGVPPVAAHRAVAELVHSPGLAAAREQRTRARRAELVLELLSTLRTAAPEVTRQCHPSAEEFFERWWATATPVVFTDIVARWPAVQRWRLPELRARFGAVTVQACTGRADDARCDANWRRYSQAIELGAFIDRVLACTEPTNDLYLIANNRNTARPELATLWDDVVLPPGWFDEAKLATGSALWLGPGGTRTPLHHDTSNILFCQVVGTKRVTLCPPWASALLGRADGVYATVSPQRARALAAPVVEVELRPGDALFLPVGWWHEVLAHEASVSLAINAFARDNTFEWFKPGRGAG